MEHLALFYQIFTLIIGFGLTIGIIINNRKLKVPGIKNLVEFQLIFGFEILLRFVSNYLETNEYGIFTNNYSYFFVASMTLRSLLLFGLIRLGNYLASWGRKKLFLILSIVVGVFSFAYRITINRASVIGGKVVYSDLDITNILLIVAGLYTFFCAFYGFFVVKRKKNINKVILIFSGILYPLIALHNLHLIHGDFPPTALLFGGYGVIFYKFLMDGIKNNRIVDLTLEGLNSLLELRKFNLTKREVEVLFLLLKTKSNKEIASELYITEGTVKNHVHNILSKTNTVKRQELIHLIYSIG